MTLSLMGSMGSMGSGRTSAGRLAAGRLGDPFLDRPALVDGTSVPELWDEVGEKGFRRLERGEIEKLTPRRASKAYGDAADYEIDRSILSVEVVAMRTEGLWRP